MKSPEILRLVESLDAFVDHEGAFQQYLREQGAETTANMLGLRLRAWNRIHPKVRAARIVVLVLIRIWVTTEIRCAAQCASAEVAEFIKQGILRLV